MRPIPALALLLALLLPAACGKERLPDGSALVGENLGLGITLRMNREAARQASGPATASAALEFITPEALLNRKPYAERPEGKDLVICLYSEEQPAPDTEDPVPADAVYDIRCYLAPVGESQITLLGQQVAGMNPDDMVALLGPPFTPMQASPDGQWHLSWYFALDGKPNRALRIVSSHSIDGHCFALEMAEVDAPK